MFIRNNCADGNSIGKGCHSLSIPCVGSAKITIYPYMIDETIKRDRFDWRFPFYAAVGALILFVPIMIFGGDFFEFLYILAVAPVLSVILLVVLLVAAIRKKRLRALAILSMLVVYWAISWGLFRNSFELHTAARWLLWSKDYKAKVLAQPDSANGALKHIEWDAWGDFGTDTPAYLVFDPSDSLLTAAVSRSPGKFSGIPCEVDRVRRLESHYYTVLFYTDTDWEHCN
jgi:hypothetical protein